MPARPPFESLPAAVRQQVRELASALVGGPIDDERPCQPSDTGKPAYVLLQHGRPTLHVRSVPRSRAISAGALHTEARLMDYPLDETLVPRALELDGKTLMEVTDPETGPWYVMFRDPRPERRPPGRQTLAGYRRLLNVADQWVVMQQGRDWPREDFPFHRLAPGWTLDPNPPPHLPTFEQWRINHGHQTQNFDRILRGLSTLEAHGLPSDDALWLRANADSLIAATERFPTAMHGTSLVNGMISWSGCLAPHGSRLLLTDIGQFQTGHPWANYLPSALDQFRLLSKTGRPDLWPRYEQELFRRLAEHETGGDQLSAGIATYIGQLLVGWLKNRDELPLGIPDPDGLRDAWFQFGLGALPLARRWLQLSAAPLSAPAHVPTAAASARQQPRR